MEKIISLVIISLFLPRLVLGQNSSINNNKVLEFGITTLYTSKMNIQRNYPKNLNNDITSSNSIGFNCHLKYIKEKNEKISWLAGGNFGLYSFNIDFYISEEFNSLGWGGYSDYYTEYKINYIDLLGGLRYKLFNRNQNYFFVELDISVNYHLRSYGTLSTTAILDNGQSKPLFHSTLINNDNNNIIISPQLGFYYKRILKDKNGGLNFGLNFLYSGREPFIGDYQIIGDNETLEGVLSKKYNYIGLNISYFTYLKK